MPAGFPPSSSDLAIETRHLRKEFGSRTAVRDLSLAVNRGEIFGFLGPNGAGKSTSIKMLLGLVHPSGGEAYVLGAPIGDVAIRRHIGFLPEDFRFYDWLTATELLELHGRLAGMSALDAVRRAPEVLDLVGMTPHAARRLRGFSKGMLQRLGLAQALIHEPQIVFLDEPTSGLDPMGRRMVRDVIRAQRDRGATVFLNSHLLSEVEVTCDRVAFIKDGQVIASQDLRDAGSAPTRQLRVRARSLKPGAVASLGSLVDSVVIEDDVLRCEIASEDMIPQIVQRLVSAGVEIYEVSHDQTSLEETFVRLVGEDRGL
jgi:ABC-2 type transport system ATP-binding protein